MRSSCSAVEDTVLEGVQYSRVAVEAPHTAAAAEEDSLAVVGSLAGEDNLAERDNYAEEDTAVAVAARRMDVALLGTAVEAPHILLHMAVGRQEERRRPAVAEGTDLGERYRQAAGEGSLLLEEDTAAGHMAVEGNLEFVSPAHHKLGCSRPQLTSRRRGAVPVVTLIIGRPV